MYVGSNSNTGYEWKEVPEVFGINFIQSSSEKYTIAVVSHNTDIKEAIKYTDVLITDSLSKEWQEALRPYQIIKELLIFSGKKIILNS